MQTKFGQHCKREPFFQGSHAILNNIDTILNATNVENNDTTRVVVPRRSDGTFNRGPIY